MSPEADGADPNPEKIPFHNRSTGFRLFLYLSLALLPLGLIAFLATLQSSRTADLEKQAQMRIALTESARQLASSFASDVSLTRVTMRAYLAMPDDLDRCARYREILASQNARTPDFALFGPDFRPWCASSGFDASRPTMIGLQSSGTTRYELGRDALTIIVQSPDGNAVGLLRYPVDVLKRASVPGATGSKYSLSITSANALLPLEELTSSASLSGYETLSAPVAKTGLSVEMTMTRTPFSAVELISFLLPFLMWASAALIAWGVVDRILVRPLRALDRAVRNLKPGEIATPPRITKNAALEIRQLAETFSGFTETISTHDAELAAGLARQTRLTREVHHRVKNNLQVVASLINLHARGQTAPDVLRAYASIQRRVDALAVVHRNHYAELEENRGVSLRALVGELAQNIRGSLPDNETPPAITLDICPCYATQDVAVPVAFILTELIELSLLTDPKAPIAVALVAVSNARAKLGVASAALIDTPELRDRMESRFARVLEGLSRQLRAPLERDTTSGKFDIEISIVDQPDLTP